jgi:SAM-dependent methyltransferase
LAAWYDGWVGEGGSQYHTKLAIPTVINLLRLKPGESVLDIGAGQGVLAQYVVDAGGRYTGVDASERLISMARRRHGKLGTFIVGDARALPGIPKIQPASFDAVVFLLSIQDMDPLEEVLESAAWALRAGGRAVLLMTHPAFRIPRQSGWGWDENRKLQYRRLDRYLTPLPVPLKPFPGEGGVSRSFHRPLHEYVNGLARCGLLVDQMREIPAFKRGAGKTAKAEETASEEFPLFLGLRAVKAP